MQGRNTGPAQRPVVFGFDVSLGCDEELAKLDIGAHGGPDERRVVAVEN